MRASYYLQDEWLGMPTSKLSSKLSSGPSIAIGVLALIALGAGCGVKTAPIVGSSPDAGSPDGDAATDADADVPDAPPSDVVVTCSETRIFTAPRRP
ncbi:MAG: hypothetical protein AAGF12_31435, partial [Myxococcota bacterium]